MQGRRIGVATQIRNENPAALPVHCFGHSLNLCLQDAGRKLPLLRDALDTVQEIGKLIKFSPKRSHLFHQKLFEADSESVVTVKSLCTTRWTARTSAIEAVLKDYVILMETMAEINSTTHDEYGLKAAGMLTSLEKFSILFVDIFSLQQLSKYQRVYKQKMLHFKRHYHLLTWLQLSIEDKGQRRLLIDFMKM